MTQHETAIQAVLEAVKRDGAVRAVFLKGSLAREEQDEFSDVDMYCVVEKESLEAFLPKRVGYIEAYKPLIYWSETNFVGPQIVGVYEDGLHLDLYTVTATAIPMKDAIQLLYDPDGLLQDYKGETHQISEDALIRVVHEFTFSLLEFEHAYKRGDLLWASRLSSHLAGDLSLIVRSLVTPDKAQLGFKRLYQELDEEMYAKWLTMMNHLGPNQLPDGVQQLVVHAEEVLDKLPESIRSKVNQKFFNFMCERIRKL